MKRPDRVLKKICQYCGYGLLAVFMALFIVLYVGSHQSLMQFRWHFFTNSVWDPAHQQFGALGAMIGTLISSALAICIALPLALGIAIFATNMVPTTVATGLSVALQVLSGIPSIIFGMWGLFVVTPWFALYVEPFLAASIGQLPIVGLLFSGPTPGIGVLCAGFVLAVMIIPLLANMMVSLLQKVPALLKESGYATGATRLEVVSKIQLPYLRDGIIGSVILGLGRALGETMAVTFVIGNAHRLSLSLFMPGNTISSTIANEFTEATSSLYISSLMGLALVLMFITFGTLSVARLLLNRYEP
jgi:phosphate transport system permease protein